MTFVVITLGTGVLAAHYIFYATGAIVAIIIISLGTGLTGYVSWVITECSAYFNAQTFEEIAIAAYGQKMGVFTSIMLLCNQVGYVIAYTVVLKTLLPATIEQILHRNLPVYLSSTTL